jgi:DMSO/TMAO reductase YedYZ molybdopterin-dependent catalytic subunit
VTTDCRLPTSDDGRPPQAAAGATGCGDAVDTAAREANPACRLIRIISVPVTPTQPAGARHLIVGYGAAIGIATALLALGVAQLVAAIINSQVGGPVDAVGELAIDHSPPAVKNFAINTFGSNDKTALVWGIWIVLLAFAVLIGVLAVRDERLGLAGLAVFMAVGIVAAVTRPTSRAYDVLPTLIGGLAGVLLLRYLARLASNRLPSNRLGGNRLASGRLASGRPATAAPAAADPAAAGPGTADPAAAASQDRSDGPASSTPHGTSPRPAASTRSRRNFLVVSGVAAGAGLVGYEAGSWLSSTRNVSNAQRALRLPAAAAKAPPLPAGFDLNIPGLSPFITPNASFYRVDTAIMLPEVLPANWTLRIHGMVRREITLSFHELIKRPLIEDYVTLCCVSNPVAGPYIGNAKWLGASLRSLLQEAGVQPGADQLLCTSVDGFTSGTPVATAMDGRDALLAVAMNGSALPVAHGFPVRLVIPGLYGYVSACKWITDIEATTYAANTAYWAQRGWAQQAPVKTESRIDVPVSGAAIKSGHRTAIAGVAWAQHKGIEAVEVSIDRGPWRQAQLSKVPDIDTWRQWVYYWDAAVPAGNHLIQARATDKTGYTQTARQVPPEPNGASGYPSATVSVTA